MARPSVGSRTLKVLRTIEDLKQIDVETRTGHPPGTLSDLERRQEPSPDDLAEFVGAGMGLPSYFIRRTRELIEDIDAARDPEKVPDPEEVARREWEEQAWAEFRDLQARLDALTEAWLEHREAPFLWRRLERQKPKSRLSTVQKGREFWSPGLCVLVCEKSVAAAARDGREAEELARLAVEIARRVPGGEARRARLEGLAQAIVGNARRVCGQLPAADEAFARSAERWSQGAGTFHELLDPSRPLDLEASFRRDQRRLTESLALLDRAFPLARSARARGRILLLRAKAVEEKGDPEEALVVLEEAEPHVLEAGDPHQIFVLTLNRLVDHFELGRVGKAAHGLEEVKAMAKRLGSRPLKARCRWLEARICAALGQRKEAMAGFQAVHEEFVACDCLYDGALVVLEMAVLLLEEHRNREVQELAEQLAPIFDSPGFHREALAALRLFVDAARAEQATAELARNVLEYLNRSRYNAEVHFDAGCSTPPHPSS